MCVNISELAAFISLSLHNNRDRNQKYLLDHSTFFGNIQAQHKETDANNYQSIDRISLAPLAKLLTRDACHSYRSLYKENNDLVLLLAVILV